jgi:hypothetical protein
MVKVPFNMGKSRSPRQLKKLCSKAKGLLLTLGHEDSEFQKDMEQLTVQGRKRLVMIDWHVAGCSYTGNVDDCTAWEKLVRLVQSDTADFSGRSDNPLRTSLTKTHDICRFASALVAHQRARALVARTSL